MLVAPRLTKLLGLALILTATALVCGQDKLDFFKPKKSRGNPKANFELTLAPADAKPGDVVTLTIAAEIPDGHHIFSTTQKPLGGKPTKFKFTTNGLEPVDAEFTPDKPPEITPGVTEDIPDLEEHHDKVTWTRKYRLKADAVPAEVRIEGEIDYGICTDVTADSEGGACYPGKETVSVALTDGKEPEPAPTAPDVEQAAPPSAPVDDQEPPPGIAPAAPAVPETSETYQHVVGGSPAVIWKATVSPKQATPGQTVTLTLEADIQAGWHLYSANQQRPQDMGPQPMVVQFNLGNLEEASFMEGPRPTEHKPEVEDWAKAGVVELYHEGKVRWTRTYDVPKDAKPGDIEVTGAMQYQVCQASRCVSHAVKFDGMLSIGPSETAGSVALKGTKLSIADVADLTTEPFQFREAGIVGAPPTRSGDVQAHGDPTQQGLVPFLLTAVVAGFVALLTPCVFPMVPITVSVFHKQAEKQHTNPVLMATVYALSIIGTFTILGLAISFFFGASALNALANNTFLNLAIAGVLIVFACNMLGMYDIIVPSWVLNLTAGGQSRGGYVGVVFMGLTFTLTSFTCTFAFAGALLAMAAKGQWLWPVFGMLAFSTAFALPFFVLALFPSMVSKLPRSGGWMNTIKVVMGLIELGLVFKFLSVADVMWNGRPFLFDFELVVSAWMVLAAVTGLYLLGLFRTPHDMPVEHISVPRLILAMTFLGMSGYIAVGLFAEEKAKGAIWEQIAAFAPPKLPPVQIDGDLGPIMTEAGVTYGLDVDKALAYAVKSKKPLFIDFTGVTCINCRLMEQGPLSDPTVTQRLKEYVLVRAYADQVPSIDDFKEAKRLVKRNTQLQEKWFEDTALPAYALVAPDANAFENEQGMLGRWVSFDPNASRFAAFLDAGLQAWKSGGTATDTAAFDVGPVTVDEGVEYLLDPEKALAKAVREQKPLLIDFAGLADINGRLMSQKMLGEKAIREKMNDFVLARLYIDSVPHVGDAESRRLVKKNRRIQRALNEDVVVPAFVILESQDDALTNANRIRAAFMGFTNKPADFQAFLNTQPGTARIADRR